MNVPLEKAVELSKDKNWSMNVFDNVPYLKFQYVFWKEEGGKYFWHIYDMPYKEVSMLPKEVHSKLSNINDKISKLTAEKLKILGLSIKHVH